MELNREVFIAVAVASHSLQAMRQVKAPDDRAPNVLQVAFALQLDKCQEMSRDVKRYQEMSRDMS